MTTVPEPYRIRPVLVRRINRVRRAWDPIDATDEMMDDIFTLWRTFEATFDSQGNDKSRGEQLARAERATVAAVSHAGMTSLAATCRLMRQLRHFDGISSSTLANWIGSTSLTAVRYENEQALLRQLAEAGKVPERWNYERDSRRLARVLYRFRCAVFHASVETTDVLARRVLPPMRECLFELAASNAGREARLSFQQTISEFDAMLEAD